MAFQPILDLLTGYVFVQEALVRDKDGRGAGEIFAHVFDKNHCQFFQRCRTTAIKVATKAKPPTRDKHRQKPGSQNNRG